MSRLLTKDRNLLWIIVIVGLCNLLFSLLLIPPPLLVLDADIWKENYLDLKATSTSASASTSTSKYNDAEYEKLLQETLTPLNNVSTAYHTRDFYSGLNNQVIRFIGLALVAKHENIGQLIEESILWKDTFGSDDLIPHHKLWDVVHWNSFFPILPRIARYDNVLHPHLVLDKYADPDAKLKKNKKASDRTSPYTIRRVKYNVTWDIWANRNITKPQPIIKFGGQSFNYFKKFMKAANGVRPHHSVEDKELMELVHKGGLRPHPFLQGIIDQMRVDLGAGEEGYMTIHARVEPDMARQDRICADRKVWNITEVINMIYSKYPEPPVTTVLIQFSRALMEEEEAKKIDESDDKYHNLNHHNLEEINNLVQKGMWGGKVKVVEAGSAMVEDAGDPFYKYYSNIAGGIVNLFLAIHSNIFVGTEISTYSTMAANMRYYRDLKENYFYRPSGLFHVTPPEGTKPFRFNC